MGGRTVDAFFTCTYELHALLLNAEACVLYNKGKDISHTHASMLIYTQEASAKHDGCCAAQSCP